MAHVDVAHLSHTLPNGRVLLDDASFRIGEGAMAALVGPNGAGKTTLIRLIAGDISPQSGTIAVSGGLGVMRQFVGGIRGSASPGKQGAGESQAAASPGPSGRALPEPAGTRRRQTLRAPRPASSTPAVSPALLPSATC